MCFRAREAACESKCKTKEFPSESKHFERVKLAFIMGEVTRIEVFGAAITILLAVPIRWQRDSFGGWRWSLRVLFQPVGRAWWAGVSGWFTKPCAIGNDGSWGNWMKMEMNKRQDRRDRGEQPKRFLALGDSYTIGTSVAIDERWPRQLVERLREVSIDFEEPTIIAKHGWTTSDLLNGIEAAKPTGSFRLVSLLIGVNNQYDGLEENDYVRELDALLGMASRFAGGVPARVMVLSIPDWSVTPFAIERDQAAIRNEIERFNERKKSRADQFGAQFVDVTPVSRQAGDDTSLLAADGLHPSAKMYAAWCELALPAVHRALLSC